MTSAHVEALYAYPLKGAGGVRVPELELDRIGPVVDRRWMLVDPDGVFLSQRSTPAMALLETTLASGEFAVRSGERTLGLPLVPDRTGGDRVRVRIWKDEVDAVAPDPDADRWFSDVLGRPCRAVFLPQDSVRATDPAYPLRSPVGAAPRVAFADGFPLLLVTQASLDGLNARLERPVPMDRFRPNVVVGGALEPHAEDAWRRLRIGTLELDGVKQCARCAVPTIDQATAERGREPIRTLATYRTREGKVYFGVNLLHHRSGVLTEGAPVEVMDEGVVPR